MKKYFILVILLVIAAIWGFRYFIFLDKDKDNPSYFKIIEKNWDVSLPKGCIEVYKTDEGPSFFGDGVRYHVFRYENDITWNEPFYALKVGEDDKEEILKILSNLKIDKEFYIDFDNINYGLIKKKRNSTLYVYYSANKMLYVIEDIY